MRQQSFPLMVAAVIALAIPVSASAAPVDTTDFGAVLANYVGDPDAVLATFDPVPDTSAIADSWTYWNLQGVAVDEADADNDPGFGDLLAAIPTDGFVPAVQAMAAAAGGGFWSWLFGGGEPPYVKAAKLAVAACFKQGLAGNVTGCQDCAEFYCVQQYADSPTAIEQCAKVADALCLLGLMQQNPLDN
jgi:hypothetical protein